MGRNSSHLHSLAWYSDTLAIKTRRRADCAGLNGTVELRSIGHFNGVEEHPSVPVHGNSTADRATDRIGLPPIKVR
jgi:hypothetical protein